MLLFLFQFGLIIYSNDAVLIFDLNAPVGDSVASLQTAIMAVDLIGNLTATPAGMLEAANQFRNFDRNDTLYPDVALVLTDGFSNVPILDIELALIAAADELKAETEYAVHSLLIKTVHVALLFLFKRGIIQVSI